MTKNRQQQAELDDLREKLNKANRKKDYEAAAQACRDIIALDARAKGLNLMVCLYHKDLGEAYLRLLEYEKAHDSFKTAYAGLVQFRATQKLKFPEDWLNELIVIERLIDKVERVHLKGKF